MHAQMPEPVPQPSPVPVPVDEPPPGDVPPLGDPPGNDLPEPATPMQLRGLN